MHPGGQYMDLVERQHGVLPDARRHPWETARARILLRLMSRLGVIESTMSWLDVGAGDTWFAHQLEADAAPGSRIVCWDTGYGDDELGTPTLGDGTISLTADRPQGVFEGVLMLDVIEHVADDSTFVRDIVRESLAPGGWTLVTVPAYQVLFSDHDRLLKHHRRYSPRSLRAALEAGGLEVKASGALFHSLLPVRGAQVVMERIRPRPHPPQGIGAWHGDETMSRAIVRGLELEGRLSIGMGTRHWPVLPGLTNWAFCRRSAVLS